MLVEDKRPTYMSCREEFLTEGLKNLKRFGKFTYTIKNEIGKDSKVIKNVYITWCDPP